MPGKKSRRRRHAANTRFVMLLLTCVCTGWAGGCRTTPDATDHGGSRRTPISPSQRVVHVSLTALPMALKLDHDSVPDGIGVNLYFHVADRTVAKTQPMRHGEVKFMLYHDTLENQELQRAEPALTWTFPAEKLTPFGRNTLIGHCYSLPLQWRKPPATETGKITLAAVYTDPDGQKLYSATVTVRLFD